MEDVYFVRQKTTPQRLSSSDVTIYIYPFNTLPTFFSHVHPKFVIFEAGRKLNFLTPVAVNDLEIDHPILCKILKLYGAWSAPLPSNAQNDNSFFPPYAPDNNDNDSDNDNEGNDPNDKDYDDTATNKGRTSSRGKKKRQESPTPQGKHTRIRNRARTGEGINDKYCSDTVTEKGRLCNDWRSQRSSSSSCGRLLAGCKRKHSSCFSQKTVVNHTRKVGKMKWNRDALLDWSRKCQVPRDEMDLTGDLSKMRQ